MVSDFTKKKYLFIFNTFFDADKNGTVDRQDFTAANNKFASIRGYKPGDVTYDLMRDLLVQIWKGLVEQADTDGDGVISADEWVQLWDHYAKNPAGAAEWQQLYCKCVFQFLDASSDGSIDGEEFVKTLETFETPRAEAQAAWNKLAKGKASINWEEFQKLYTEFFVSENPSDAGNYIFGELK